MKVTVLGCGGAGGVPMVSVGWGACDPAEPRNRRRRPSILVEEGATRILVDTSPDLREQLLSAGVNRLDAVLYTHAHADHINGIDDLREVNRVIGRALPVHADAEVLAQVGSRFGYAFEPMPPGVTYIFKPLLEARPMAGPFRVGEVEVIPFEQDHGTCRSWGFRFGRFAYSTDVVDLSEAAFATLAGIDTWIVGTLVDKPHDTHAHVDKALQWIARLRPRRAYLTHMSPRLDYATLKARLPAGVEPAYDGLEIGA